jgi:hypothetical protein
MFVKKEPRRRVGNTRLMKLAPKIFKIIARPSEALSDVLGWEPVNIKGPEGFILPLSRMLWC